MKIQDVIIKLLIEQPYYGYVASSVTLVESEKIDTIRMASIPSLKIYYNPEWFESLPIDQQKGVILHELLHVIFMHQYRRMNREILLWSVACDMAVNEMISKRLLFKDAITVEKLSQKLKRNIERNKNAEYYYDIITDADDLMSFAFAKDYIILIFEGDKSLKANKLPDETASSVEMNALKSNLIQIMEQARAEGELPSELENKVDEVYRDIKVNWRIILKRFLTGRGKMMVRKSFKRQSRRFENLPGTKRAVGVRALLAIDESGSISDSLVKAFYKELQEINKIIGVDIMVTRFDTECTDPVPLNQFLMDDNREKRGGTDFRPVFTLADKMKMPLIIIFTDGDGTAPISANQNTLWVLTKNAKKPAEFGYYVTFEII